MWFLIFFRDTTISKQKGQGTEALGKVGRSQVLRSAENEGPADSA
jgi:hypothetical protein